MNQSVKHFCSSWSRNKVRNVCFIFGMTVLLVMVWMSNPALLLQNVRQMGWCLPGIVFVWFMGYVINTCSWGTIIRQNELKQSLSFFSLFRYTVTGFAINYITPLGLLGGEPYRIMEMKPYLGVERASGSVLLYMMMHFCSHFLFWITSCLLIVMVIPTRSVSLDVVLTTIFVLCMSLLFLFFKGYKRGMIVRLASMLEGLPWLGRRLRNMSDATRCRLVEIDANISSLLLNHPRAFYTSLALEFLSRIVNCGEIFWILWMLGTPCSFVEAVIVVSLSSLLANLLFFSPLQLGTREGGIYLALCLLPSLNGVVDVLPVAVSVSLMTRVREFVWIGIGLAFLKVGKTSDVRLKENN